MLYSGLMTALPIATAVGTPGEEEEEGRPRGRAEFPGAAMAGARSWGGAWGSGEGEGGRELLWDDVTELREAGLLSGAGCSARREGGGRRGGEGRRGRGGGGGGGGS